MIKGGYILQPRVIDQSKISKAPPHVREIWLYLLRKANHSAANARGKTIQRGQLHTSYLDIREALSWQVGYRKEMYKKHHCETAMKLLVKENMITTTKTTRGMIVTICNYDYYQNPKNYGTDSETDNETYKKPTMNRQDKQECKNVKNGKENNPPAEGDFIDKIIEVYKIEYLNRYGIDYIITNEGQERSAAGKIIGALKKRKQNAGKGEEEMLEVTRKFFAHTMNHDNSWLQENMTMSIIYSKINSILKGKVKQKSSPGTEFVM